MNKGWEYFSPFVLHTAVIHEEKARHRDPQKIIAMHRIVLL